MIIQLVSMTVNIANAYMTKMGSYMNKVSTADRPEDLVDGSIRRYGAVEYIKLSLEALWYVVTSATRVDHCAHQLNICNVRELTRLLEVIETLHLHQLTCYLVCHLNEINK